MILTLAAKTPLGGNAWAFRFTPERPLPWTAGQFIKVEVPHPTPDAKGTTRRFTIAAAPHEQTVTIATRITTSTFKQALAALPIGDNLNLLDTPAGDFLWKPSAHPHIFVAHGIGITPFYAIIKDRLYRNQPTNAHLIYTSRANAPVLFETELAVWAKSDPSLKITLQSHLATPDQLAALAPDLKKHFVYVSSPKPLITLCMPPYNLPLAHLKQDNFPGYATTSY